MKLTSILLTATLIAALILGALAWTPTADAYEPICADCKNVPFQGNQCVEAAGDGRTNCFEWGLACILTGGHCVGLTAIQK